nr:hypothetical protein [uncultured bacterium]
MRRERQAPWNGESTDHHGDTESTEYPRRTVRVLGTARQRITTESRSHGDTEIHGERRKPWNGRVNGPLQKRGDAQRETVPGDDEDALDGPGGRSGVGGASGVPSGATPLLPPAPWVLRVLRASVVIRCR